MALNFTNESRSYDPTRHAVRFWGYDQSMEVSFFVTEEALRRLQSGATQESDFLSAFDAYRSRIREAAAKVYGRGRQGSYELRAADL